MSEDYIEREKRKTIRVTISENNEQQQHSIGIRIMMDYNLKQTDKKRKGVR